MKFDQFSAFGTFLSSCVCIMLACTQLLSYFPFVLFENIGELGLPVLQEVKKKRYVVNQ